LQFFLFRVDRNQKVVVDGIVDKKIRNGFKRIFQLIGLEKIGSTEGKIAYRRTNTTPSLLQLFDQAIALMPKENIANDSKQPKNQSISQLENTQEVLPSTQKKNSQYVYAKINELLDL